MLPCKFWHVCYLKPRSEKIVKKKIEELQFEVFLPLVKQVKIYKTAKKNILLPLFPGYIFVNITPGYRHHITEIPEVYRFIKFKNEYARVSDEEIENLQILVKNIKNHSEIQSEVLFQQGKIVEVTEGPFQGIRGKIITMNGKRRVMIQIDAIKQAMSIDIDAKYLSKVESHQFKING